MKIEPVRLILVMPFYWLCLCNHVFVVSGLCHDDQWPLLLQFKHNLTFIPAESSRMKSWDPRHDCCMWLGVTCDEEGHVTGLDLSGESISGGFDNSSSLFSLQHLQKLSLAANNFNSDIPSGFNKLEELTYLNLSYAGFVGQIPVEISQLTSLHGNIPYSLCNAPVLQVLDLSMNNISGTMPSCLMAMTETLGVLNLRRNNLTGPIPDMFPASCALRTLDLQKNKLDGQIPKSLANCSALEVLDLGRNQIIDGFPCMLKNITTLRVLILRENKFYGHIGCAKTNGTWHMLQIVDLAFNNFSGELPGKSFTRWEEMMSDENHADSKVNHIRFQVLQFGEIYYQDSVTVTSKGRQMELVKILTVFTSIDFSSNHFEGEIPKQLFDFKALYVLNLSNNALSGQIPSSIGNQKQLESLDLSSNSLEGEIPTELASLSFLSFLNLSFNQLYGQIPTGTQIQSFPETSFIGNKGLFGPPLSIINSVNISPPMAECERLACSVDWNFLSVELGFVFGIGILIGSLLFWKQGRVWYWQLVHKTLCWIFPHLNLEHVTHRGQRYMVLRWQF